MKKLFLVLMAVLTILLGSSFKPNTTSQKFQSKATPQQDQCYKVKVTFDVIFEKRTARWGGTVIESTTGQTGASYTTSICAKNESEAREEAERECHNVCNNGEGKYVKETSDGYYLFEIRRVTRTEIIASCGNC